MLLFCVRTTKKIFLLVFRMNSNPCKNEILADARVKSANADEIFGFASDEIKSTHSPSRRISPNEVGFHRCKRFHPPARVDLVEKNHLLSQMVFFLAGVEGFEPSQTVLETGVLPLTPYPYICSAYLVEHQGLEPRTNRL